MRLKHIKLAGFKSFVDSTTITFPDPMTAIVGPNGCGKSNVIDAVRWVLGESSAKNLRGDAMSDVIFNGASQRKPVSQASVELFFSDTQGRLSGSLAERSEVAIKRIVNRDGHNQYYLNGSKCRRRDIVDIFLGTGLGPRSYAIIEQGMISRLIESKPKDLRVFIDEAAGISKYKERRRETEIRLRHTEENLARLQDIQQTLQEQVLKLAEQAEQARQYRDIRQEERLLQQQVLIAKWQNYQKKLDDLSTQLTALAKQDLRVETELNELNSQWEVQSEQLRDNESLQHDTQQDLLGMTQKCAKLEQQLQHHHQQQKQFQQQKTDIAAERQVLSQQLEQQESALEQCIQGEIQLLPEYELTQATLDELRQQLAGQHEILERTQEDRDTAKEALHHLILQQQRAQNENDHLTRQHHQLKQQLTEYSDDSERQRGLECALADTQHIVEQFEADCAAIQERIEQSSHKVEAAIASSKRAEIQLSETQTQLQQYDLDVVSLESQQHLLSLTQQSSLSEQLDAQDIPHQSVWAQLQITDTWQKALETVLSGFAAGFVTNELPSEIDCHHIALVKTRTNQVVQPNSLLSQITKGDAPAFLNAIGLANSIEAAKSQLLSGEWQSLVTPSGDWLGHNWWLKGSANVDATDGFFARQEALESLRITQASQAEKARKQQDELAFLHQEVNTEQVTLDNFRQQLQNVMLKKQENSQQSALIAQQIEHEQQRQQQQQTARERDQKQQQVINDNLLKIQQTLVTVNDKLAVDTEELASLQTAVDQQKQQGQQLQQQVHVQQQTVSKTQSQLQDIQWQKKNSQQALEEKQQQINAVNRREEALTSQQLAVEDADILDARLQEELAQKLAIEQRLQTLHHSAQLLDETRQKIHQSIQTVEVTIKQHADKHQQLRIDHERQRVLQETVFAQIQQIDSKKIDLSQQVAINITHTEKQIQRLQMKVKEMGPVNLAAIAEHQAQSEKLTFMQQQHQDLSLAVETLQKAIQKIDRETRQRFKETFDKINAGLQELFPKVFAGGSAWLALTEEEDVLDAGVHIMARPPGKKNATIHLLSGGEKALTALSLVFAIFRLNPAPFCLLDEVDAPLDDANVGRFCNLVQEMSNNVQFIYISHNKVAMEMAAQLIGVTMYEPGVSRVVAVDVAEALQLDDS